MENLKQRTKQQVNKRLLNQMRKVWRCGGQIIGSMDRLCKFADEPFDFIICHNVLEYTEDRADIVREFAGVLKPHGKISIVKHNRTGRVMQMIVLLNDFEKAHSLLSGNDGMSS